MSICGQTASDYPEIAQGLIKKGVNALSLDMLISPTQLLLFQKQSDVFRLSKAFKLLKLCFQLEYTKNWRVVLN